MKSNHQVKVESEIQSEPFEVLKSPSQIDWHPSTSPSGYHVQKPHIISNHFQQIKQSSVTRQKRTDQTPQFEEPKTAKSPIEMDSNLNLA